MKPKASHIARGIVLAAAVALGGCVQLPTENVAVVDMRPRISFVIPEAHARLADAVVYVNGQEVGKAGAFLEGKAAVRVLPGPNLVKVVDAGRTVMEERVYLGDGVARSFILK